MPLKEIGTTDDFPPDQAHKVEVDGIEFVVFNIQGELYGVQNLCPHHNMPLDAIGEGKFFSKTLLEDGTFSLSKEEQHPDEDIKGAINEDELTIHCPWHYLEWDLEDGKNEVTGMEIPTYDIGVKDDGKVYVDL